MSDPIETPEAPKKGQLNEKQIKLLAAMTQNTVGKVEYNVSPTKVTQQTLTHILTWPLYLHSGRKLPSTRATRTWPAPRPPMPASAPS